MKSALPVAVTILALVSCGGGGSDGDPSGNESNGSPTEPEFRSCRDLPPQRFSGFDVCFATPSFPQLVVNELVTFWGTQPALICGYDGFFGTITACGPTVPNNAFYCPLDDTIGWDRLFMNRQTLLFGDFASVSIVAHEWGHLNQERVGILGPPRLQIQNELHADCQAGIAAAVAEARGLLDPGDLNEAFFAFCVAGDPVGFFDPDGHGDCLTRVNAFNHGLLEGRERIGPLCTTNPLPQMQEICSVF